MIKIAYCIREGYLDGGDGVQAVKTRQYIEDKYQDIQIDILDNIDLLNNEYKLVHIFNYATPELTKSYFEKAIQLGIKIVSSPVYWDYSFSSTPLPLIRSFKKDYINESFAQFHQKLNKYLSNIPLPQFKKAYFYVSNNFSKQIRFFIDHSKLILPNSQEEGDLCCEFAKTKEGKKKIRVVFNGVDVSGVHTLEESAFFEKYQLPRNYVLQVGRMEYLKNQLNLLAALKEDKDIPVVFLGNMKCSPSYVKKLQIMARERGNVYFVSNVPHDEVYSFYKYASVHVLLSMRESPGLVSLEALSQGCPIVVSDRRFLPVDTYFTEQYESVNPFDLDTIRKAVLKSMNKEHYPVDLSKFSWAEVARQSYEAYCEVLK